MKQKALSIKKTLKVVLKKYKSTEINLLRFIFNSTTKIVISYKSNLKNTFKEIFYRIDNWINEGYGYIVELKDLLTLIKSCLFDLSIHLLAFYHSA